MHPGGQNETFFYFLLAKLFLAIMVLIVATNGGHNLNQKSGDKKMKTYKVTIETHTLESKGSVTRAKGETLEAAIKRAVESAQFMNWVDGCGYEAKGELVATDGKKAEVLVGGKTRHLEVTIHEVIKSEGNYFSVKKVAKFED